MSYLPLSLFFLSPVLFSPFLPLRLSLAFSSFVIYHVLSLFSPSSSFSPSLRLIFLSFIYLFCKSRDSSVGRAVGYWLDSRGYTPSRRKIFLFSIASTPGLRPTQPPLQWVQRTFAPGVKRPWHEADHSSPSSAEVKDSGAIPPLTHMYS
jgi:hypothetical protein